MFVGGVGCLFRVVFVFKKQFQNRIPIGSNKYVYKSRNQELIKYSCIEKALDLIGILMGNSKSKADTKY